MEFRQLNTFITAAQLESFSKAAQLLGYSQSAVTVQIRLLEEELNTRLFDRLGKGISLTVQGQRFLEQAQLILKEVSRAKEMACEEPCLSRPLHIGTLESLCFSKLPAVLKHFRTCHPKVPVKITTASPGRLYEMLDQNQLDLIYLLDRPRSSKNWIKVMERREPIVFVASAEYWGRRRRQVKVEELLKEPCFLTEKNENYRRELDAFLEARGNELVSAVEIGNTEFIIQLLKENGGISYIPFFAARESVEKGELMILEAEDIHTVMYQQVFIHKNKWKTREMEECIRKLQEIGGEETGA